MPTGAPWFQAAGTHQQTYKMYYKNIKVFQKQIDKDY